MPLGKYWVRSRGGYKKRVRDSPDRYYTSRKTYRSQRRRTGKGMNVLYKNPQNVLGHTPMLPLKKWGSMPYYDNNNFSTGAAGAAGGYVFTANGLYDPNITGVGHQPMGFDQMMLFYEHYTVTKAKITVNFYNNDVDDSVVVGILIAPDATIETNASKINENGLCVRKWLSYLANNDGNKCSLTMTANIAKINGKRILNEDDYRGDAAANPQEQSYFHLFAYNQVTTNAPNVFFEVLIEYIAEFSEPRKMIQS